MSRRVLVTGASGFAGRHLVAATLEAGDRVTALARDPRGAADEELGEVEWITCDLRDAGSTRAAVASARPDVVHHLAALAFVPDSWEDPAGVFAANTAMTWNVLEAVRREAPGARVVLVSSGEVYGPPERLPVDEAAPLRPQNPYAVSKAAADLSAGFAHDAHGLDVVRVRAFNHAGPGQEGGYAISSFTRQVAEAQLAGADTVRIVTGNPDARRDYTDVRDVARAYVLLAGGGAPPGVYNVCSGRSRSVREIVEALGAVSGRPVEHEVDPALVRAHDVMEVRGSAERLAAATGWRPQIPLEQTLADAVGWWRGRLARARASVQS